MIADNLQVYLNPDGSYTFKWDPSNPDSMMFNSWTKQDFIDAILALVNT